MSHQTQTKAPVRGDADRRADGVHVSTRDARQAEVVLDTPRKRWLIIGIFGVGVIALGVLIRYFA